MNYYEINLEVGKKMRVRRRVETRLRELYSLDRNKMNAMDERQQTQCYAPSNPSLSDHPIHVGHPAKIPNRDTTTVVKVRIKLNHDARKERKY